MRPTLIFPIAITLMAGPVIAQKSDQQDRYQASLALALVDRGAAEAARERELGLCLGTAARGRTDVSACYTSVSGSCLDEIDKVGGNLGNAAINGCVVEGLRAWYAQWLYRLNGTIWTADSPERYQAIIERYAEIQKRAGEKCLKASDSRLRRDA